MVPCRGYAEEHTMTLQELEEKVVNVLKLFDKVNPEKVGHDCMNYLVHTRSCVSCHLSAAGSVD